jgi:hypothetical protein
MPLNEKAIPNCKVNGFKIKLEGVILKPNDRICIGPSAHFLFKNKQNEANASMPDPDSDPITFDFASEEVHQNENMEEKDL